MAVQIGIEREVRFLGNGGNQPRCLIDGGSGIARSVQAAGLRHRTRDLLSDIDALCKVVAGLLEGAGLFLDLGAIDVRRGKRGQKRVGGFQISNTVDLKRREIDEVELLVDEKVPEQYQGQQKGRCQPSDLHGKRQVANPRQRHGNPRIPLAGGDAPLCGRLSPKHVEILLLSLS